MYEILFQLPVKYFNYMGSISVAPKRATAAVENVATVVSPTARPAPPTAGPTPPTTRPAPPTAPTTISQVNKPASNVSFE